MNNKLAVVLLLMSVCAPFVSIGQDESDEDVFELSPFTTDGNGDRGYRATSTLAGSRVRTDLKDVGSAVSVMTMEFLRDTGATIESVGSATDLELNGANGVRVEFGIGFFDDLEKVRRTKLNEYLEQIQGLVSGKDDLDFEPGALILPEGDRKKSKSKRKAEYTSYARFAVSFDFRDEASPLKRVMAIRRMIMDLDLESEVTKLFYGQASLIKEKASAGTGLNNGVVAYGFGYSETSDMGSTVSGLVDALSNDLGESEPRVAVSLVKKADAIKVDFVIDLYADKESDRVSLLNESLALVRAAFDGGGGFRYIPGALLVNHGDWAVETGKRRAAYASQAHFSVAFDLSEGMDGLSQVRDARRRVRELEFPDSDLRLHFGEAKLVVKRPEAFRSEILAAIFADLGKLESGLGDGFMVESRISDSRVQLRRVSPTEVEVWIPYSFDIVSIRERELQEKRMEYSHLEAMAAANASNCDCCRKE